MLTLQRLEKLKDRIACALNQIPENTPLNLYVFTIENAFFWNVYQLTEDGGLAEFKDSASREHVSSTDRLIIVDSREKFISMVNKEVYIAFSIPEELNSHISFPMDIYNLFTSNTSININTRRWYYLVCNFERLYT